MSKRPTIGFIGLGIMGTPTAKNLVDAGYDLVVHDVRDDRVEALEAYGTGAAASPALVAAESDVVITFLPEGSHVREVALGPDGLIEGADAGLIFVDMSTIGPATIRDVAAELDDVGVRTIDAPVSGSERGAKAGTLRLMVGSDDPLPEAVSGIFNVIGDQVVRIGDLGAGQVAKICNNMVGAASTVSLAEALIFAEKAGVDQEKLVEGMKGATGHTWILDNRALFAALWQDGQDIGDPAVIAAAAETAGLDPESIRQVIEDDAHRATLQERFEAATDTGITGVPTFVIDGRAARGAVPPEQLRQLVEG